MDKFTDKFQDYMRALQAQQETDDSESGSGEIEIENDEVMEVVGHEDAMELAYDIWRDNSRNRESSEAVGGVRPPYSEQSSNEEDRPVSHEQCSKFDHSS